MSALSLYAIIKGLDGKRHGSYWTARCPAHDDHHPSLSISEGTDGVILLKCHAGCSQDIVIDALRGRGLWPGRGERQDVKPSPAKRAIPQEPDDDAEPTGDAARRIWRESVDSKGTWAEEYLAERGLKLPSDPEIRCRTLRFHADARRQGKPFLGSALVAAFTPIEPEIPEDPFLDPPVGAIHRIRGRGHDNKFMLGPSGGKAIMISPWWQVHNTLHVCEGVETALALYAEGATGGVDDPDAFQFDDDVHRPIWALGSAGAIAALPVIQRVRRLIIWADHDRNGTSLKNARHCADLWSKAGRHVVIRYPENEGEDYADRD